MQRLYSVLFGVVNFSQVLYLYLGYMNSIFIAINNYKIKYNSKDFLDELTKEKGFFRYEV